MVDSSLRQWDQEYQDCIPARQGKHKCGCCPVAEAPVAGIGESELQVAIIQTESSKSSVELGQPELTIPAGVTQPNSFAKDQHRDKDLLEMIHYLQSNYPQIRNMPGK